MATVTRIDLRASARPLGTCGWPRCTKQATRYKGYTNMCSEHAPLFYK